MTTASNSSIDTQDSLENDRASLEVQSMNFSSAALAALASPYLWHLGNTYAGGSDFVGAWSQNNAAGVTISIVDQGVNYLHADLVGSYNTAIDYDPRDVGNNDAMPDTAAQHHGTNVAG